MTVSWNIGLCIAVTHHSWCCGASLLTILSILNSKMFTSIHEWKTGWRAVTSVIQWRFKWLQGLYYWRPNVIKTKVKLSLCCNWSPHHDVYQGVEV
jgi:hypothetical protein